MRTQLLLSVAAAAIMLPGAAYAQSTGSADFEGDIVITSTKARGVGGVEVPDTGKSKVQLNQEFIQRQTPGQSILETINSLPGVSFQNQDPYGSSGGRLTIRGFGPDRISLTVDGVPLNDTGNYAIYSNQQVDPELIDNVNVSLGSTDIDSPTASASGSTVNYRTITPTNDFGVRLAGSYGGLNMFRTFALVNTGQFTPWGTKAWFSYTHQNYDVLFSDFGEINKEALNFKIYQPIGGNGDFVSIAGNWNVNRNWNTPDWSITTMPATLKLAQAYHSPLCTVAPARPGLADTPNSCGTSAFYEQNINPSNTGTLRINSRFTLAKGLVLTVDPTFWYTKANGGAYGVVGREATAPGGYYGYIGNSYYTGQDLNGDGDQCDRAAAGTSTCPLPPASLPSGGGVEMDAVSQTITHRWIILSSLRYDFSDTQTLRLNYTHDYGRHRQTGEMIGLQMNGQPIDVFPVNDPLLAPNGYKIQKRDRKSFAVLDQVSAEYRGKFLNDALVLNFGARLPWFKRNLHQNCFTTSATGFLDCIAGSQADIDAYAAAHPSYGAPGFRQFTFSKLLPSANLTYQFGGGLQAYASYSKSMSVPGTDNLYNTFFFEPGTPGGSAPKPETTDNFDVGLRYNTGKVQAFVAGWYTIFTNRLASSYDPINDITLYRNLGRVDKYGVDASVSYSPIRELTLYAFGSYLKSKIKDDVAAGFFCTADYVKDSRYGCTAVGDDAYYFTAGKREAGAPTYTLGARGQVNVDPIVFGAQVKRTGPRYLNDQNMPLLDSKTGAFLYGAKTPAYTVVDLDARVNLEFLGLNKTTYVQFNVSNLFNEYYVGNLGNANTSDTSNPFVYLGSPRTAMVTLNVQF